jgi:hypothetical protein
MELDRIQVGWWRSVFEVSDPSASWYRLLIEGGEADRASAKILVRAISLVNRLSLLHEDELPRQLFDVVWGAGGATWVGGIRRRMSAMGLGLAREATGHDPPTSRKAKRTLLRNHIQKVVWPAVRQAEADAWWGSRRLGHEHRIFNSWEPATRGVEVVLNAALAGEVRAANQGWRAVIPWVQLRVLNGFNPSRFNGEPLPCALCSVHGVQAPPFETARHLLWDCQWGARPEAASWAQVERQWLGGVDVSDEQLLASIQAIGHLAERVWRTRPVAERVQEDAAFQSWLMATGVMPLVGNAVSGP